MAEKYTYADVIIDPNDPRVEVGKEYFFEDTATDVLKYACDKIEARKLKDVDESGNFPFIIEGLSNGYACLIRKKEPVKKYVPFDFDDFTVRRDLMGKTIINNYGLDGDGEFRELMIIGFENKGDEDADDYSSNGCTEGTVVLTVEKWFHADELLKKCSFVDGSPCGKLIKED